MVMTFLYSSKYTLSVKSVYLHLQGGARETEPTSAFKKSVFVVLTEYFIGHVSD